MACSSGESPGAPRDRSSAVRLRLAGGCKATLYVADSSTDADYALTFEDGSSARNLLVQRRSGAATAMGLGPTGTKAFIGAPGAVDEALTVVGEGALAGKAVQNLAGEIVIEYVADEDDGHVLVVTRPRDDWSYADFRVFYGARADAMVERELVDVYRGTDTDVVFRLDGKTARAHFTVTLAPPSDGGGATFTHGPATFDAGDGVVHAMTERLPAPTSLPGFSFTCF